MFYLNWVQYSGPSKESAKYPQLRIFPGRICNDLHWLLQSFLNECMSCWKVFANKTVNTVSNILQLLGYFLWITQYKLNVSNKTVFLSIWLFFIYFIMIGLLTVSSSLFLSNLNGCMSSILWNWGCDWVNGHRAGKQLSVDSFLKLQL